MSGPADQAEWVERGLPANTHSFCSLRSASYHFIALCSVKRFWWTFAVTAVCFLAVSPSEDREDG